MILMFNDHDLDEIYQSNFGHSFTYDRVLHACDDPEIVNLDTVIGPED